MKLVVGLGNPGKKYEHNRHNVGFMLLDSLGLEFTEKFGGLYAKKGRVHYFKPLTFMNNSGIAVSQVANFYKIPPEEVVVAYDELDLVFGKIKIKQGGGDGGHNGIKSIDAHFGKNYWRLRFGIGHPGDKNLVHDYVLGDFSKPEQKQLPEYLNSIAKNLPILLKESRELFLTRYYEEAASHES